MAWCPRRHRHLRFFLAYDYGNFVLGTQLCRSKCKSHNMGNVLFKQWPIKLNSAVFRSYTPVKLTTDILVSLIRTIQGFNINKIEAKRNKAPIWKCQNLFYPISLFYLPNIYTLWKQGHWFVNTTVLGFLLPISN